MTEGIVFKPFKTAGGCYIYDRFSNSIIKISQSEYERFNKAFENDVYDDCEDLFEKYQRKGVLHPSIIEKVENPIPESVLKERLETNLEQLILQVTQNCNFRCEYCAYSGSYYNRTHNNKRMSFETAKKAIDFAILHSSNSYTLNIAFYGGEPLLEKALISDCIKYIKKEYPLKNVGYIFTTNASLIDNEMIEILVKNDFTTVISLDGPEEIHDSGRKLINGKGSFDNVFKVVRNLYENYNDYYSKHVSFNAVLPPGTDIVKVSEFFNNNIYLKDNIVKFSTVSTENSKEAIEYDKEFYEYLRLQRFNVILSMLGKIDKSAIPNMFKGYDLDIASTYRVLRPLSGTASIAHHGGPCTPGIRKLYVNVDGDFSPCEKLNEASDLTKMGSLDMGYDISKILEILNIGKLTEIECKRCWNFYFCGICVAKCEQNNRFSKEAKLNECPMNKFGTALDFMDICTLKAFKYNFQR